MNIKKVLFISSEVMPYAKSGGLADVSAAVPNYVKQLGVDIRIVMPLYGFIKNQSERFKIKDTGLSICVKLGALEFWCSIKEAKTSGRVTVYFIEHDYFFNREGLYNDKNGEFKDNPLRFAFFCQASLQLCKDIDFIPEVIHCNDWMSSLAIPFLKLKESASPLRNTATVLTLHNLAYQGKFAGGNYSLFDLEPGFFNAGFFEDFGMINILKGGIQFADILTTVSPTYAVEITGTPGGNGLDPYLKARGGDLIGILNGVDYKVWNPKTDKFLPANYSVNKMEGKKICKAELQKQFNLHTGPDIPLIGLVGRLTWQKGFDLILEVIRPAVYEMLVQFVFLGAGDRWIENEIHILTATFPGFVGSFIGYDEGRSHLIEAGSDFFLMPSLFEPCGLNQIYSLKYGTLPIVRNVGGLADTIENYNEATGEGTGFMFSLYDAGALKNTIGWAVSTYFDRKEHLYKMSKNAMKQDFSWEKSAEEYLKVYERANANQRRFM